MTTWTTPNYAVDGISSATPLSAFKFDSFITDNHSLLMGNIGGSIGETSSIVTVSIFFSVSSEQLPALD